MVLIARGQNPGFWTSFGSILGSDLGVQKWTILRGPKWGIWGPYIQDLEVHASMGSGTGSPLEGPKGHQQEYGDLQETAIARALAGWIPSGLGYPGWDPGKVLFGGLEDLGSRVLDIPGMAQRARSADIEGPGISRMWGPGVMLRRSF